MTSQHDGEPQRYEDVLRALGHYLDESRYFRFAVVELPDGFLIKGRSLLDRRSVSGVRAVSQTLRLDQAEMDALLADARARRATPEPGGLGRRIARAIHRD